MSVDALLAKFKKTEDVLLIKKAYLFSYQKLSNIKSNNGVSLWQQVLSIVNVLLDFNADILTIASALIYETLNYGVSEEEVEKEFGNLVARISCNAVTINNLEISDINEFEKFLKETLTDSSEDVRSLFIKLAERYYIMQNMKNCSVQYQRIIAKQTLNLLVPTASRLGLNFIRSKLEDLCLYYLEPQKYNEILRKLGATPEELKVCLGNMKNEILDLLLQNGIDCVIKVRVKSIYSIYNKLCKGKTWENIYDILAIRIIVENEMECRKIIQLLHAKYIAIPTRFKDYISSPKENMYQSIHTTIVGQDNQYYEIQVRTNEMNKKAEKGSASHMLYKMETIKQAKK